MQRYLCWTHKSTWHYRETNYTLRDVCFWSLTSWNYPLHFAHACHLQESSVTLPACSLHPWILVDGSRAAHPWLGGASCESWVELWKLSGIVKAEVDLLSALLLFSYQALLAVRDEVLTRQIYFWLQPPFPPQPHEGRMENFIIPLCLPVLQGWLLHPSPARWCLGQAAPSVSSHSHTPG